MTDRRIRGHILRVEYFYSKRRLLHVRAEDGQTYAIMPHWRLSEDLPEVLVGAFVEGTISETKPGMWFAGQGSFGVLEETQQFLEIDGRPLVLVDTNEASQMPQNVADFKDFGFNVITDNLAKTGMDYKLSSRVGIQRKSFDDLCGSIMDNRIWDDMDALASNVEKPILLIEGLEPIRSQMQPNSWEGVLAAVIRRIDTVQIVQRPDRVSAMRFMRALILQEQLERRGNLPYLKEWLKDGSVADQQLAVLQQLPGVGPIMSRRVLSERGTVAASINMTDQEWAEHLSRKKTEKVMRVTKGPFKPTEKEAD